MSSLNEHLFGAGVDAIFKGHSKIAAPFPSAGRRKDVQDYDADAVASAIKENKPQKVDPRTVHATQPSVTQGGVSHYAEHGQGVQYADQGKYGNDTPVVYNRTHGDQVTSMLLSGHHRATAALAKGEQFDAIVASGGYGPPRKATR